MPVPIIIPTLVKIFALIKLLQSDIDTTNNQLEKDINEIERFKNEGIDELRRKIADKSRKVKLDILHETKRSYVDKSNAFYKLKMEFDSKIKFIKQQREDLHFYKDQLFKDKKHDELKYLKDKTVELKEQFENLVTSFREMDENVRGYNGIVKIIKFEIEKIQ